MSWDKLKTLLYRMSDIENECYIIASLVMLFNVSSRFFHFSVLSLFNVTFERNNCLRFFQMLFRFKTSDFCVQMELRSIKKLRSALIGAMLIVKPRRCITEAIILTFTELDQLLKVKSRSLLTKKNPSSICNMPKQVCTIFI